MFSIANLSGVPAPLSTPDVRVSERVRRSGLFGEVSGADQQAAVQSSIGEKAVTPVIRQNERVPQFQMQDEDNISETGNAASFFPNPPSTLFLAQMLAQESGSSEALANFARIRVVRFAPSYAGVGFSSITLRGEEVASEEYSQVLIVANDNQPTEQAMRSYQTTSAITEEPQHNFELAI